MKITIHYDETKTKVVKADYIPDVGDRIYVGKGDYGTRVEQRTFSVEGKSIEAHVFLNW